MPEKMFKSSPSATAGVAVGSETARMHGTDENYIQTDGMGTFISGQVSLMSTMPQIRTGGMWTFNDNWKLTIPSTLGTPVPVLNVDPPLESAKEMAQQVAIMMKLYGMNAALAGVG